MVVEEADPGVVFIGGVRRSGSDLLARVLDSHPRYRAIPVPVRFHSEPEGLPDLLGGRVSLARFSERMRGTWWTGEGTSRLGGLDRLVPRERFDQALARLESSYHADPLSACRNLFFDLLRPLAQEVGKSGLVEITGANLSRGALLARIFPNARFIHAVRDGRAVAVSIAGRSQAPASESEAMDWWCGALWEIDSAVRGEEDGVSYSLGPTQLHVLALCDLAGSERDRAYEELLAFLHISSEPGMRALLDAEVDEIATWRDLRRALPLSRRVFLEWRYRRVLRTLQRHGVHCAPQLLQAYRRS